MRRTGHDFRFHWFSESLRLVKEGNTEFGDYPLQAAWTNTAEQTSVSNPGRISTVKKILIHRMRLSGRISRQKKWYREDFYLRLLMVYP